MRSSEDFFYQRLGKKSSKKYQKDGTNLPQDVQFSNKIFHNHFPRGEKGNSKQCISLQFKMNLPISAGLV